MYAVCGKVHTKGRLHRGGGSYLSTYRMICCLDVLSQCIGKRGEEVFFCPALTFSVVYKLLFNRVINFLSSKYPKVLCACPPEMGVLSVGLIV